MRGLGNVRRMDDLRRVVIPKEVRELLNIASGDPIEFYIDGDRVIIQKYVFDDGETDNGECSPFF